MAQLLAPAVTVIDWSLSDLGRATARLLLDRLSGAYTGPPRHVTVPTGLLVRESCAPPA